MNKYRLVVKLSNGETISTAPQTGNEESVRNLVDLLEGLKNSTHLSFTDDDGDTIVIPHTSMIVYAKVQKLDA
jgi:hypothetical protein